MSEPKHDLLNSDVDFWIAADGAQLGHLHVSKGGIDWYEGKASKAKRSLTWEKLAELLKSSVPESRATKPKLKR